MSRAQGPEKIVQGMYTRMGYAALALDGYATMRRIVARQQRDRLLPLQDDSWRLDQLLRSTSNPNHPFSKFTTGRPRRPRDLATSAPGLDGVVFAQATSRR